VSPVFLILLAVIVTLLLTLFLPRLERGDPRLLWLSLVGGVAAVVVIAVIVLTR